MCRFTDIYQCETCAGAGDDDEDNGANASNARLRFDRLNLCSSNSELVELNVARRDLTSLTNNFFGIYDTV